MGPVKWNCIFKQDAESDNTIHTHNLIRFIDGETVFSSKTQIQIILYIHTTSSGSLMVKLYFQARHRFRQYYTYTQPHQGHWWWNSIFKQDTDSDNTIHPHNLIRVIDGETVFSSKKQIQIILYIHTTSSRSLMVKLYFQARCRFR